MQKIALIGGGGHAKVIIDLLEALNHQHPQFEIIGIFDDLEQTTILGFPKLGNIDSLSTYTDAETHFIIAIGNNEVREKLATTYSQLKFATLIHPSVIVGSDIIIGTGSVVMAGCIIQAHAQIGKHCIINTGAIVDHDVRVGDYSHIAQRVTLTGGVQVGKRCLLNAGTIIAPWQIITDETILPVGSRRG